MKAFRRPLATLFAVALLVIGVMGVYRMGWREGYGEAWVQAQPREDEQRAPWTPWGRSLYGVWGRPRIYGGHLGRLLSLGLVLLVGAIVVKGLIFRGLMSKAWHLHTAGRHGTSGKGDGPWGHGPWKCGPHGLWPHGPHPHAPWGAHPCGWDKDAPDDAESPAQGEQFAKVKPDPDAG